MNRQQTLFTGKFWLLFTHDLTMRNKKKKKSTIMKTIKVIIVLLALSCLAASAIAKVTAFDPNPKDLKPNKYFTWGISFNLSQEKVITGGTLNCDSVYDARTESDGRSYTYFLDNFAAGA